ncbi:SET and MYND domain-containing protein 4 [Phlebotomus argentipes]|uniref:SET and MYND domain-containing protein 4 n=1 Tax=Phlebotomus argentipes TaxID=94469 RepID=UPI0028929841|nr:SET and MYND domain-containing protein 4 [Phlebotomus argentipes]
MENIVQTQDFFKTFCNNVVNSVSSAEFEGFSKATTDRERCEFVSRLSAVKSLTVPREKTVKCLEKALALKKEGNNAFQKKEWRKSLDLYNQSYFTTPSDEEGNLAVIFANRSAALYHMEKHDLALKDIARAIEANYPREMRYKLIEREARCYLAQEKHEEALQAFKKTITALDDAKLPEDKHAKMERDAQIMVKMLTKTIEKCGQKKSKQKVKKEDVSQTHPSLAYDFSESEGRFAKASADINVGETIVAELPHCSALLERSAKSHCHHCFMRFLAPLCCATCSDALFCSAECREIAVKTYHRHECGILPILWRSGTSIICHLSLRTLAQKNVDYFLKIRDELVANGGDYPFEQRLKFPNSDFRKVCNLFKVDVKQRSVNDVFQHAVMAYFLAKCLAAGDFFADHPSEDVFNEMSGFILRTLQVLQFNTHEVFELRTGKTPLSPDRKTIFIGGALYPTVALFNHSCDPGIVRYFRGNRVFVHAIKNIKAGEIVAENYGPLYTQEDREQRHETLKQIYYFDCMCTACQENWPLFEDMKNDFLRFRCDSKNDCGKVICVPVETNDFMIRCVDCGEFTNLLKGLKAMQDIDVMNRTAERLHRGGSVDEAVRKYIEILKLMSDVLVPPFRDYVLCQQNIRDCLLEYGNRFVV